MKLKRVLIAGVAVVIGVGVLAGPQVYAWAQTLAGSMAAGAAGATLGAAAGSGILSPSDYTKNLPSGPNLPPVDIGLGQPGMTAPAGVPNVSIQEQSTKSTVKSVQWGHENGRQMLNQLTNSNHRYYPHKEVGNRTPHHRKVLAKYTKPPRGWLGYYLPADRYKITSDVWQAVTTPNDKFFYEPWVLATKHRRAGEVIGFHTWQDAMIAGYRPDPVSLPAPGRKLAIMASYSDGSMMQKYIEYVYAGQIAPVVFEKNYEYVMKVAHQVESSKYWSHLLVPTVEQAIGATLGLTSAPTQVGTVPVQEKQNTMEPGMPGMPGGPLPPGALPPPGMPPAP